MRALSRRLAALVVLAGLTVGCQRGCLARWLADHGLAESPSQLPPGAGSGEPAPCPPGLARCAAGAVQVSRAYTPPSQCSPEGCRCPWDDAGRCELGCAADGVTIEADPSEAHAQLCATRPGESERFSHILAPGEPPPAPAAPPADGAAPPDAEVEAFCEVEAYRCADGVVSACDSGRATAIAVCKYGCLAGEGLVTEPVPRTAAVGLLCRHDAQR